MTVLSLFDGMSCGQQALSNLNVKIDNYYSSEIDKYAMSVTRYNYPKTNFIGSVTDITIEKIDTHTILLNNKDKIDVNKLILIGGSPCQGFSFAGKMKGAATKSNIEITTLEQYLDLKEKNFEFEGQSYLFWEYIRIKNELLKYNPNLLFLLENVKMTKKWKEMFNKAVGVEPVEINSALLSAQNRKRFYWSNLGVNIQQPQNREIWLKDILNYKQIAIPKNLMMEQNFTFKETTKNNSICKHIANINIKGNETIKRVYSIYGKSPSLTTMQGGHRQPKILYTTQKSLNLIIDNKIDNFKECVRKNIKKEYLSIIKSKKMIYQCKCKSGWQDNKIGILKSPTVRAGNSFILGLDKNFKVRKLSVMECERLQTVKDNYTAKGLDKNFKEVKISNTQRYKMIGNGWTVAVVEHILKSLLSHYGKCNK